MSKNVKQLRSISLYGYKKFVTEAGKNPELMLQQADIPVNALDEADLFIPLENFSRLLEITAEELNNPTFGMDYAFSIPSSLPSLTPLSFLAYLSRDLVEWVNFNSQYLSAHNYPHNIKPKIVSKSTTASLELYNTLPSPPNRHVLENNLALTYRLAIQHINSEYAQPIKIKLPFSLEASVEKYEGFFNCPVEFDAKHCEMVFNSKVLSVKLDAEKTFLANAIQEYFHFRTKGKTIDLITSEKVRLLIPCILGTGRCNLYNISKLLGIGTKTLQRHLEYENTSFSEILDEVRQAMAKRFLKTTSKSSTAIAILLDYSSLKAFSFAFKRWTGTTPNKYR